MAAYVDGEAINKARRSRGIYFSILWTSRECEVCMQDKNKNTTDTESCKLEDKA